MTNCNCHKFPDLGLDLDKIKDRVRVYRDMRAELSQVGTKLVERWLEHYRLYRCDECDQYWQASLAPRDSDTWYLYKVPRLPVAKWKRAPFVPPHHIALYLQDRDEYIANSFELRDLHCRVEGCEERAIDGLLNCHYHQWMEITGSRYKAWLDRLTWYPPYSPELLNYERATESGSEDSLVG